MSNMASSSPSIRFLATVAAAAVLSSSTLTSAFVPSGTSSTSSSPFSSSSSALSLYVNHDDTTGGGGGGGPASFGRPATAPPSSPAPPRRRNAGKRRQSSSQAKKTYLHEASTPAELEDAVRSEPHKLVVVRFHAPYCRACKSIEVAYDRLAKTLSSSSSSSSSSKSSTGVEVKFVDVQITDRLEYPDLEIPATPFAHIYHPELGLIEASPIARRQLTTFKRVLNSYVRGQSELPAEFLALATTKEEGEGEGDEEQEEYVWEYDKLTLNGGGQ